jgi:hypothetical protein
MFMAVKLCELIHKISELVLGDCLSLCRLTPHSELNL